MLLKVEVHDRICFAFSLGPWFNFLGVTSIGIGFLSAPGAGVMVTNGIDWNLIDIKWGKEVRGLFGRQLGVCVRAECLRVGEFGGLLYWVLMDFVSWQSEIWPLWQSNWKRDM